MSAPLKRNRSTPSEFVPVDASAGDLLNHHQYMAGSLPAGIRPAKWSMKAVRAELEAMAEDERWDGNTRYVSLRGRDSDYNSTIPTMWATIHWLKPGERIDMHRHTPGSLYYIIQGSGYSTIDRYRIDWDAGDTFSCPYHAWTYDLGGRLIKAPHMEQARDFAPDEVRLSAVRVGTLAGAVFVDLDADTPALASVFAGMEEEILGHKENVVDQELVRTAVAVPA